jgi:hypothetical protein
MTAEVVRQKNIVMSPAGPVTNNDCADEAQQEFTQPDPNITVSASSYSIEVEVTLRLKVSQSVCLGVETSLGLVTTCYSCRKVALRKLRSCFCGASSLTRGRVCSLQCNHSMVRVAQNP